jgi:hypothetical protein
MTLEEIIESKKFIINTKSEFDDDRLYYEDEEKNILYIFGPSAFIRKGYSDSEQDNLFIVEFEGGPKISVGQEVLKNKFAKNIIVHNINDIPLVEIFYEIQDK